MRISHARSLVKFEKKNGSQLLSNGSKKTQSFIFENLYIKRSELKAKNENKKEKEKQIAHRMRTKFIFN